jgi:hypothetical protein
VGTWQLYSLPQINIAYIMLWQHNLHITIELHLLLPPTTEDSTAACLACQQVSRSFQVLLYYLQMRLLLFKGQVWWTKSPHQQRFENTNFIRWLSALLLVRLQRECDVLWAFGWRLYLCFFLFSRPEWILKSRVRRYSVVPVKLRKNPIQEPCGSHGKLLRVSFR